MIFEPIRFIHWKPVVIDGVKEGLYEVSDSGKVRNVNTGKYIQSKPNNTGYQVVRLFSGDSSYYKTNTYSGRYKHMLVHRLVMYTFEPIDNPESMTVNHIDANKNNNYKDNLEWATQAENNEHGIVYYKKYGSNNYQAKFTKDQLRVIIKELEKKTRYKDILNIIGVEDNENNRDYIGNIKRGKTYQREIKDILEEDGSSTIESITI